LLLTSLCVAGLHLALLGSPLAAVSSLGGQRLASRPASASPVESLHASRPEPVPPGTDVPASGPLSLRTARLALAPASAPSPDASDSTAALADAPNPDTSTSVPDHWTLAQASTEGEPSLRPGSTEIKVQAPAKLPNSARLQFDVLGKIKGFGYTVSGELLWQHDGRQYQSRYEIGMPLLGSRVQTSQGQVGAGGLMPTRFGDKVRSEQAAHFERDKGLISFSANTPSAPLEPGAQDRLSLFMQLAALLSGAPQRYPTGTLITLQIVSAREAEPWTLRVDAPDTLQLPLGPTPAVRLTRLPRQPYDQQVDLWFAPALGYLPVRLRVTHPNGDVADQVLRRLDPPG
jgi:hypothetical protein